MDKIGKIKRVIELVYMSAFLKGEKPLSLMLIAPPDSSKSHFILEKTTRYCHNSTDLSFSGLVRILAENKNIKHIVISDFLKITGKKQSTKNNFLTLLNNYLEEGIYGIDLGNKEKIDFLGRNGGIITATTDHSYAQNKKSWEGMGLSSRFIILRYEYTDETYLKTMTDVLNKKRKVEKITLKVQEVNFPIELQNELILICGMSFRKIIILEKLAKTIALSHGRNKVCKKDLEELKKLNEVLEGKINKI